MASEDLVGMREKVYNLLKDTPFRAVIFHEVSNSPVPCCFSAFILLSLIFGVRYCADSSSVTLLSLQIILMQCPPTFLSKYLK